MCRPSAVLLSPHAGLRLKALPHHTCLPPLLPPKGRPLLPCLGRRLGMLPRTSSSYHLQQWTITESDAFSPVRTFPTNHVSLPSSSGATEDIDKANMCLFSSPTPNLLWRGAVEKENGDPWEPGGKGMEKTDGQRRARCISRNTVKCD